MPRLGRAKRLVLARGAPIANRKGHSRYHVMFTSTGVSVAVLVLDNRGKGAAQFWFELSEAGQIAIVKC